MGGGAVIVPVLYEVFRLLNVPEAVRMQLCVGTSIAIIVPTTIQSYLAHRAEALIVAGVIRLWAVPAVLGVTCGAAIRGIRSADGVQNRVHRDCEHSSPQSFCSPATGGILAPICPAPCRWPVTGSASMGISGGSLSNIVLTLHGKSIHQAVATSAGLGVPITIAGTLGYILAGLPHRALLPPLSLGFVSLIGVVAPVSSFAAPYGARLAHRLPRRTLEIAFGIFLLLMALRFLVSLF
jgi:uncharacterized protein